MRLVKHRLVSKSLFDFGKESVLLIVVVRLYELVPGETITNEIGLVVVGDGEGLMEDGIVPAKDRVM